MEESKVMFKTRVAVFLSVFKTTRRSRVVLDPIKYVLRVFWTASKTFLEKRVSREFITMMLLWTLELSVRQKHLTPHTNKKEDLSGFKTTARDVLSTIW